MCCGIAASKRTYGISVPGHLFLSVSKRVLAMGMSAQAHYHTVAKQNLHFLSIPITSKAADSSIAGECYRRRTIHNTHRRMRRLLVFARPCTHDRISRAAIPVAAMLLSFHGSQIHRQIGRLLRRDWIHSILCSCLVVPPKSNRRKRLWLSVCCMEF